MLQVLQLPVEGNTVLDAEHDTLDAGPFVGPELFRSTGDTYIVAVLFRDSLYLVEDSVSIGFGLLGRLGQIGHHDCSVQSSLRHLMQVHEYSRVPLVEVDALWKQHRCVAVGVKGQDPVVQLVGLTVGLCLLHQPLEQGVAVLKTLRMPLHTHHRLVLRTLHGLDDTVCRTGCHTELRPGVTDSLVVERVDKDGGLMIEH